MCLGCLILLNWESLGALCCMCRALQDAGFTPIPEQKTSVAGKSGLKWVTLSGPAGAPVKGTDEIQQGVC